MKTVLIIEDDPIILHIYKNQIEKAGFAVETAINGEDGLHAVQQIAPDFILLDLMLPKLDGLEFLKRIRGQNDLEQKPIFVFTNVYLSDLAKDAAKAGATQVFDKSVAVPQDIIKAIRDFLGAQADSSALYRTSAAQANDSEAEPLAADANAPDSSSQHELIQAFIETAPETLLELRKILQALAKSQDSAARLTQLAILYERIHSFGGGAAAAELRSLSQLSAALEALLKQLTDKPDDLTPSSLRTLSHATDFLDVLFKHDAPTDPLDASPLKILVVDDESLSRRAIVSALERARLTSVEVDNPKVALQALTEGAFDLIFLDVSMPDMNGFDLCRELRKLPIHKTTPIIFVTSSTDFESRSQGALSGGNDLIAKPFLFTELAVKALNYALRNRFSQPEVLVREIAVTNPIKSKKPKAEAIVFGDHGEVLPPEPEKYTPREKGPAPSSKKEQSARAAVPKSVSAVIESSFPSMSLRSNSNTAQSIPAAKEKVAQSPDAEAVDRAETEGSRFEKPCAEHTQVRAQRPEVSSEGQHAEARFAELAKSHEALTEELNRLRLYAQTNSSPEPVTVEEPATGEFGEQAFSSDNGKKEGVGLDLWARDQSKDLDNQRLAPNSSWQMSAEKTSEPQRIPEQVAKLQDSEAVLKTDPNKQGHVETPLRPTKSEIDVQPNQKRTELTMIPRKVAPPKDKAKERYERQDHSLEPERRESDALDDLSQKLCQVPHQILGITQELLVTPLTTEQRALVASVQSRAESLLCLNQALIDRSRVADAHVNTGSSTFNL
ncbi:MAG: response regulator, partial [Verrucomicrobiota bacterium]